jgi:hypothetical protein
LDYILQECIAKEEEDKIDSAVPVKEKQDDDDDDDDGALFYSDIMPLLVSISSG